MKTHIKTPTLRQKIEVYEGLLHDLCYARIVMNHERIVELLRRIDSWSYAHRQGNGENTVREQQQLINHTFHQLRDSSCSQKATSAKSSEKE